MQHSCAPVMLFAAMFNIGLQNTTRNQRRPRCPPAAEMNAAAPNSCGGTLSSRHHPETEHIAMATLLGLANENPPTSLAKSPAQSPAQKPLIVEAARQGFPAAPMTPDHRDGILGKQGVTQDQATKDKPVLDK
jgi:hypothetical protein